LTDTPLGDNIKQKQNCFSPPLFGKGFLKYREVFWAVLLPNFLFREGIIIKDYQINEQIRDRQVTVIDAEGKNLGVMSAYDAQKVADEQGLDLVKIAPQSNPPICKLMDYDKFRFDSIKKEKEAKKNQKIVKLKEIQLSIVIDVGDINVKAKRANEFIAGGDKVRVVIRMRGRQNKRPELGMKVMDQFFEKIQGAVMEQPPVIEGNTIRMQLAPVKK